MSVVPDGQLMDYGRSGRLVNRRTGRPRPVGRAHGLRRGGGHGRDLHEYRRSEFIHLGRSRASLSMLMDKSRRRKPESGRYFIPRRRALAKVTSLLGPAA